MSRWIDADALIKQLKSSSAYNDYEWSMYADGFIEDTENAPSIDIVRCKECKLGGTEDCPMDEIDDEYFCNFGEREGE